MTSVMNNLSLDSARQVEVAREEVARIYGVISIAIVAVARVVAPARVVNIDTSSKTFA
jgi:Flp pilus assembly pilin Flp